MKVIVILAQMSLDLEWSFTKCKISLDLVTVTLVIGGALPRPSRSRRALPQSGPSNSRNRSRSNIVRPVSDWNNVHCCSLVYLFGGNNYWLTFSVTLHSAPKYFINFLMRHFGIKTHIETYQSLHKWILFGLKNTSNKNKVDYAALWQVNNGVVFQNF